MRPAPNHRPGLLRFHVLAFIATLVNSYSAFTQPKDTLYFYNTTVLVGKLRSIKVGYFEFDGDGIGIVKIKNNRISSMHAQSRSFRVETTSDSVLNGGLTRSYRPGWARFQSEDKVTDLAIQNITTLSYYGQSFRSRIDGNLGAGFSYTKSSEIGRINFNARIRYSTTNAAIQFQADAILTYDSIKVERENENMRLSYNYSFPSLWTAGAYATYQRNLELGLDRRWQQVVVAGRKFNFNQGREGLLITGVAINQEQNLEGIANNNTEVIVQLNYNLFYFEKPNISLTFVQTGYASITQQGRYRADGDINVNWELVKDFYVNFRFYHVYDSQSPATGEPNVDWGTVAGLSYKF